MGLTDHRDASSPSTGSRPDEAISPAADRVPSTLDFALLLTATIDVREVPFIERRAQQLRLADYKDALKLWLTRSSITNLIFCENSGHDLTELRLLADRYCGPGRRVDFLSFDGQSLRAYPDKGVGEWDTFRYVLDNHPHLCDETRLLKVTGRYFFEGADAVVASIRSDRKTEVFCDLSRNLAFAKCAVFCASVRFFRSYLLPAGRALDEAAGRWAEHVLAEAVHRALADGVRWSLLPRYPAMVGVSGTSNRRGGHSFVGRALRRQAYRVKRYCFETAFPK